MHVKFISTTALATVIAFSGAAGEPTEPDSLAAIRTVQAQRAVANLEAIEPVEDAERVVIEDVKVERKVKKKERTNVFPIVKVHRDERHEHVKVLPVIVGEAFSHERHGDHSETELLDIPFASLMKHEEHASGKKELKLVNLPFTTMVEAKTNADGDGGSLKLVDVPFFTLLDNKDKGDGKFDNKFLKLPIVGSLFRHRKSDDEEKVRFLIFSHTRKLDENGERIGRAHQRETREDKFRRQREARY